MSIWLRKNAGIELLKLDLDIPLEDQGPFDLILHKFTDILVKAEQGHNEEKKYMENIQSYIDRHPECIIVDPLEMIRKLLDRYEQYQLALQCDLVDTDSFVFTPTFVELTSIDKEENNRKLKESQVQFPIICKPVVAHGTKTCHQMAIIFNEEGLKDISPPCVAQTFVNHNATLYKIFKIGSKQYIRQRPSLKNMYAGDHATIFFDTQDVSKPDSSHHLNEMDCFEIESSILQPDMRKFYELSEALRRALKLDLFGVDVIIECDTNRIAVIDINVFPSYDEVDNFFEDVLEHLQFLLNQQEERKARKDGTKVSLKDTGRKPSGDLNSENAHKKRMKFDDSSSDEEKVCYCEKHTGGLGKELTLTDSIKKEWHQGVILTSEQRNKINFIKKNHTYPSINGYSSHM
ncbi:hypothetical protein CHS0354_007630 [Potamilus streckersoni]|uniref:Inositol-tetrakisphosphate 1-kinase n=1 Tax=Potamilus streckersoni TaxID=2493646 RepID=A0AAE0VVN2_9BIVA|nr:hypothetical protein CHS0354_007630 [Potamilus streckersoni]